MTNLFKIATENSVFSFGKHRGRRIKTVLAEDPSYLPWCITNIDDFIVDPKLVESGSVFTKDVSSSNFSKLDIIFKDSDRSFIYQLFEISDKIVSIEYIPKSHFEILENSIYPIFKNLDFYPYLEQRVRVKGWKEQKSFYNGRVDLWAETVTGSYKIALEYDDRDIPSTRSMNKLSNVDSNFNYLILKGEESITSENIESLNSGKGVIISLKYNMIFLYLISQ